MSKKTGVVIAATAAAMFAGAILSSGAQAANVKCAGVNSCKGTSACKTATSSCKGLNSCKGQGFLELSAADCKAQGGKELK